MISRIEELKGVTVIKTMDTSAIAFWLAFGNAIKRALFMRTFWKIGVKNRSWISFNSIKFVKRQKREKWLQDVERSICSMHSPT